MNDEILEDDYDQVNHTLPQFLNVLTILTFIGSGLTLIMAFYNLATIEQQRTQIEQTKRMLDNNPFSFGKDMMRGAEIMLDNIYLMQGTAILVAIACIYAALQMRKLNKNGFYIYSAACVVSIAVPLSFVGFGFMGGIILSSAIFSIAFIIMYGVNLKHMR